MDIKNKVVLITGANRGIGKALVEEVAKQGAKKIYAAARDIAKLSLPDDPRFVKLQLDIVDAKSIQSVVMKVKDVEILFNNAGIATKSDILNDDMESIRRDMETNYFGTLQLTRAMMPLLLDKSTAAIVNILSVLSLASISNLAGYCASKAALFSATQALRSNLRSSNVKVFSVYPGPIDTDMTKNYDIPKPSAEITAEIMVHEIMNGKEDIFPDPMSQDAAKIWLKDPKALEKQFAEMQ